MKWLTHQMGAVLAALSLTGSPLVIGSAFAGGILPDVIDQKRARLGKNRRERQKIFNSAHRGASHWFGWWLLLFFASAMLSQAPLREIAAGLALGGLSHVGLDMLTTRGVPLVPFTRKGSVSLRFCSTGSWKEYVFLAAITLSALALGAWRLGFLPMPL